METTDFSENHLHKDKIFNMNLETYFFKKKIDEFKIGVNKIDKSLAILLNDAVDSITEFLSNAKILDQEQIDIENSSIDDLIPSMEIDVLQMNRYYLCRCCNSSVRASSKSLNEHFYSTKHMNHLRKLDNSLNGISNNKSIHSSLADLTIKPSTPKDQLIRQQKFTPKEPPYSDQLIKKCKDFLMVADMEQYSNQLINASRELQHRDTFKRVCFLIENKLSYVYPNAKCFPFGSSVIGMGTPDGDLDIFVDTTGQSYFQKQSKTKIKDAIRKTEMALRKSNYFNDFEPVFHARTPILRTYCNSEKIDCDLSYSNGLSSCNTALIQYFIELQPVCKQLAVIIKYWAKLNNLGTNSYLVVLLVIFYLQVEGVLPAVQRLQQGVEEPVFIDGWMANFKSMSLPELNIQIANNFNKYLLGFFNFYGNLFLFDDLAISVYAGRGIFKSLFDIGKESELSNDFYLYKKYMNNLNLSDADEIDDLFANRKCLVIQDPFELIHNVGKGVPKAKLNRIISLCRRSFEILSNRTKI